MITRRSIMRAIGFGATSLTVVHVDGSTETKKWKAKPAVAELPLHLAGMVRTYDPNLGDLGRGRPMPIDKILDLRNELRQHGFAPYATPGFSGASAQLIRLYGVSGAPAAGIWCGMARQHEGRLEFMERTGCGTVWQAMQSRK